jgi:uncharacterized damage-inducible protein DinB
MLIALGAVTMVAVAARSAAPAPSPMTAIGATAEQWASVSGFIQKAAEQVPESSYAYKPTPSVRSFGQLIGHLAGVQDLMCGGVLGQKTNAEDSVEKNVTTKAALVAAIQASNDVCKKAYAISDANAGKSLKLFGEDRSALYWLISNMGHDNEHYGNIVTYMRMMNMVPPSSQPAPK